MSWEPGDTSRIHKALALVELTPCDRDIIFKSSRNKITSNRISH